MIKLLSIKKYVLRTNSTKIKSPFLICILVKQQQETFDLQIKNGRGNLRTIDIDAITSRISLTRKHFELRISS